MTIATNTHHLRPALIGAAWASRRDSVRKLIEYGLLRDATGRKLVRLDYADAERKLKERVTGEEQ